MSEEKNAQTHTWRVAAMIVAFVAVLAFGVIVLAGGDWIPGLIIVVAALIGLSAELPVARRLRGGTSVRRRSSRAA